jgi:NADPH:quinone reductase-like Zn-dependent oxidoreductase
MSTSSSARTRTDRTTDPAGAATPTVRAIVHDRFGSADVLHLGEVDRPTVGKREVLVSVLAAGLDRGTWHLVAGRPLAIRLAGFGVRRPKHPVPGSELAGVVVEVGRDVTRFQPGDEVFGMTRGSFAELVAAPEKKLAPMPTGLTFEQAAAVPISGVTALQGLCDVGRLAAGQSVLITGASGGVGTFAVQIAKAMGAQVTGVCSTAKVALVRSLGADRVLDYTRVDPVDGSTRYDLIFDIAGNAPLKKLRRAVTPHGTVVIVGGETDGPLLGGTDRMLRGLLLSPFIGPRITGFVANEEHGLLERLTELIEAGLVTPVVDRTYSLADAPDALRRLDAGEARGKLVITP